MEFPISVAHIQSFDQFKIDRDMFSGRLKVLFLILSVLLLAHKCSPRYLSQTNSDEEEYEEEELSEELSDEDESEDGNDDDLEDENDEIIEKLRKKPPQKQFLSSRKKSQENAVLHYSEYEDLDDMEYPEIQPDDYFDDGGGTGIRNKTRHWTKNGDVVEVPYIIDKGSKFTAREVNGMKKALREIQKVSCIRFVERKTQNNYINFTAPPGKK